MVFIVYACLCGTNKTTGIIFIIPKIFNILWCWIVLNNLVTTDIIGRNTVSNHFGGLRISERLRCNIMIHFLNLTTSKSFRRHTIVIKELNSSFIFLCFSNNRKGTEANGQD